MKFSPISVDLSISDGGIIKIRKVGMREFRVTVRVANATREALDQRRTPRSIYRVEEPLGQELQRFLVPCSGT